MRARVGNISLGINTPRKDAAWNMHHACPEHVFNMTGVTGQSSDLTWHRTVRESGLELVDFGGFSRDVSLSAGQSSRDTIRFKIGCMLRKRKAEPVTDNRYPQTFTEWKEIVENAIDDMPWFGISPFRPTISRNPRQNLHFEIYYDRRVLLSWLVGRPISEIAKRAGCSSRYVYKVLDRVLYENIYRYDEEYWEELGLFAVLDAPNHSKQMDDVQFETDGYGPFTPLDQVYREPFDCQPAVGVCLVCHRVVVLLPNDDPTHDLSLIPYDRYWPWITLEKQKDFYGHLACHFFLESDWTVSGLFGPKPRFRGKLGSLRLGSLAINQLSEWIMAGSPPLTPVIKGKAMDPEDARRWWLGILNGKGRLPKS